MLVLNCVKGKWDTVTMMQGDILWQKQSSRSRWNVASFSTINRNFASVTKSEEVKANKQKQEYFSFTNNWKAFLYVCRSVFPMRQWALIQALKNRPWCVHLGHSGPHFLVYTVKLDLLESLVNEHSRNVCSLLL